MGHYPRCGAGTLSPDQSQSHLQKSWCIWSSLSQMKQLQRRCFHLLVMTILKSSWIPPDIAIGPVLYYNCINICLSPQTPEWVVYFNPSQSTTSDKLLIFSTLIKNRNMHNLIFSYNHNYLYIDHHTGT